MRIERAIDAYLDWRQLERDATPRSIESYRRILYKLAEEYPEIELGAIATADLRVFLAAWVRDSGARTRRLLGVNRLFGVSFGVSASERGSGR